MATALEVAQFFVAKGINADEGGITNLKLQKLIYYAQGFHLALFNEPLFEDQIEAWTHGPVVPVVYHHFKSYGSNPITDVEYDTTGIFSDEQKTFLNEVHDVFGQFSAWKLRNMTHAERPWIENESTANFIPQNTLKDYFKTRIK